jgi:UDP-N-acetylglucosamine/UDP-N-acetylgalactosamine diphosphorylase
MNMQDLLMKLEPFRQDHLVKFWNDLVEDEQDMLYAEISDLEVDRLAQDFHRTIEESSINSKILSEQMRPISDQCKGSLMRSTHEQLERYETEGLKAIANGEVAVILLAGGQGTRLGVNYPKGMYSVDLPSGKTLYQLQAERLFKVKELASERFSRQSCSLPWYIMASEHTISQTSDFFSKHDFFGLDKKDITFFEQGTLPCFTTDGKFILDSKFKLSRAPDGNGGLYRALREKNILEDMASKGFKYIHIYCVDNILVKIADPIFIGFCIEKNACCAAKVIFIMFLRISS